MAVFQTIIHPTDFDEASREAFRVARSLAQLMGAQLIVFHAVPPPAWVTQDGKVVLDAKQTEPTDLWETYRGLAADTPDVPIQYTVVVGHTSEAKQLLETTVRSCGAHPLVVMGTHGRTGISRLFWGSRAEEFVRDFTCPVLVVKAPPAVAPPVTPRAEAKVMA